MKRVKIKHYHTYHIELFYQVSFEFLCHRHYMYRDNDWGPIYNQSTKYDVKYFGSQWGQVSCFFKYSSNKHPNHKVLFSCINYCPTVLDFYLCYLYEILVLNTILEIHISSVYFLHLYWKNCYHVVYLLYSRTPYLRALPLIAMFAILLILLACYVIFRNCKKQEGK